MSSTRDELDGLRRAAEQAASAMRLAADELSAMATSQSSWGKGKVQRQQLDHAAKRLTSAADLLVAEVAANSPRTAGLVARVARRALLASGGLALAVTAGMSEGAGQAAYESFKERESQAQVCLDLVAEESDASIRSMTAAIDGELDRRAEEIIEIATRRPELSSHPAYLGAVDFAHQAQDEAIGIDRRLSLLMDAATKVNGFIGPLSDYEDDPDLHQAVTSIRDDVTELGLHLNALRARALGLTHDLD